MQALKDIQNIERNNDNELELTVVDGGHIEHATPRAAYQALQAMREAKYNVLEITHQTSGIPILLIDEPAKTTKLAKAAKALGAMQHVSIRCAGECAEVVWHVA
ncbi:MAG: hypothetical protein JKY87_00180 [Mariprofundus sp.]|nr:hypothetical protein [Mariprofundus sp.]